MVKIEAIVRVERIRGVLDALADKGLFGVTVYEVKGSGRQKGLVEHYRGLEIKVNVIPKAKLEIVVKDFRVGEVVDTIKSAARTGEVGDGLIFLSQVEDVIRIRTGERGPEVLAELEGR